ncbi:MAG: hypothetical protein JSW40_08705 [Candidatus Omnitrophota bacterium]|nr:MAG: hypothetical protein JSW40_08705 [Candidatus Omnitrophota bacterium]
MSKSDDVVWALVICGFGVWSFFWGFKRLRRKRLIENIPTSTIRGLALGLVELVAKAQKIKTLKSPLTGTECVFYRYTVERYESRGRSGRWVVTAKGDSFSCPFWLDDGTGRIMLLPAGAELMLPVDYEFRTGWGKTLSPHLTTFMEKNYIRYRGLFGTHTLRFREWYIQPNQSMYVLGTAKKTHNFLDDHREKLMGRLRELKKNPAKMKEVDLNKDGAISVEEWDFAVEKVERELIEEELASGKPDEATDVVIGKGQVEKIFILSDQSQKELTKKLSWQAMTGVFGGAILALIMLGYLLFRIKVFGF